VPAGTSDLNEHSLEGFGLRGNTPGHRAAQAGTPAQLPSHPCTARNPSLRHRARSGARQGHRPVPALPPHHCQRCQETCLLQPGGWGEGVGCAVRQSGNAPSTTGISGSSCSQPTPPPPGSLSPGTWWVWAGATQHGYSYVSPKAAQPKHPIMPGGSAPHPLGLHMGIRRAANQTSHTAVISSTGAFPRCTPRPQVMMAAGTAMAPPRKAKLRAPGSTLSQPSQAPAVLYPLGLGWLEQRGQHRGRNGQQST